MGVEAPVLVNEGDDRPGQHGQPHRRRQGQEPDQPQGIARADDNPATLKNRLDVYYKNTAPLLDFYSKQGKVVTLDGMAPIDEVTKAIATVLGSAR